MKRIIKIIGTFSFILMSNYTIANTYEVHVPIEKDHIKFSEEAEEGNNGVGQEPGETCSNSFAYVAKSSFNITYGSGMISFTLKDTTGYDSYETLGSKKFVKVLVVTNLVGISSHAAGALIAEGTPLQYRVLAGESIRMTVTPQSYDMETFEACAGGVPVEVINATYEQIISLPPT